MPTHRGIKVSLNSQFDVRTIPEYPPPASTTDRTTSQAHLHAETHDAQQRQTISPIKLAEPNTTPPILDVYISTIPASQFWISYEIDSKEIIRSTDSGRYDENDDNVPAPEYVYFKLLLNGECVVSWGVGTEHEWKGKTMWALGQGNCVFRGDGSLAKKGFFFSAQSSQQQQQQKLQHSELLEKDDGVFEIRVFRARGRKRTGRVSRPLSGVGEDGNVE